MSRTVGIVVVVMIAGVGVIGLLAGGCTASRPAPNIADPDAEVKIAGIKQAESRSDRASLPALVEQLNSDDPAVRLFAMHALETFAGERFGYEYYFDEEGRKASVARWQEWLKTQRHDASAPSGK